MATDAVVQRRIAELERSEWVGSVAFRGGLPKFPSRTSLPTASAAYAYRTVIVQGTPDQFYACTRNVAGAWHWAPLAVQQKGTTGAPTHSAQEGTLLWNSADNVLYANNDGSTAWTAIFGAGAAHTHASASTGGQLDWDNIWTDAVHTHDSAAEGGTVAHSATTGQTANDHHAQAHGHADHTNRTRTFPISLGSFRASAGTPTFGGTTGGTTSAWHMAFNDGIDGGFTVPSDYVSGGDLTIFYRMASATSGVVALRGNLDTVAEGASIESGGTNVTLNDTVQDTANKLNVGAIAVFALTLTAGHWCRVRLDRTGAGDTAAGNMEVIAIMFTYTADS